MKINNIPIHKNEDFEGMRNAGKLVANILDQLENLIIPGINTLEINDFCHNLIIKNNAIPAPLNYKGFPKSVCTSVNHVVCHGIPSENKILNNGDIINVDVTVILDGWHGDSSRMFVAGKTNKKNFNLIKTTYDCLLLGIKKAQPGNFLGDIGYEIQQYAEKKNYSVVRDFCGHGINTVFHDQYYALLNLKTHSNTYERFLIGSESAINDFTLPGIFSIKRTSPTSSNECITVPRRLFIVTGSLFGSPPSRVDSPMT